MPTSIVRELQDFSTFLNFTEENVGLKWMKVTNITALNNEEIRNF
jgi:hypothetical protein